MVVVDVEESAPILDAFRGGDDSGDEGGSDGSEGIVDGEEEEGTGTVGVVGLAVVVGFIVVGKRDGATVVVGGGNEIVMGGKPEKVLVCIGTVGVNGFGTGTGFEFGGGTRSEEHTV